LGDGWGEGQKHGLTIIYKKVYGSEIRFYKIASKNTFYPFRRTESLVVLILLTEYASYYFADTANRIALNGYKIFFWYGI